MRLCLAGRNLKEYSDVMSLDGVEGDGLMSMGAFVFGELG